MPLKDYVNITRNYCNAVRSKKGGFKDDNVIEAAGNFSNLVADPKDLKNPKRSLS